MLGASLKNIYDVKKELKRLSGIRGSGTELISIYVPPDYQLSDEIGKLKEEHGQAGNIKSKSTRQNVQGAIDRIIQYLRLYKKPPPNGFAIFAGNISSVQANPDIELFSIEPPQPVKANMYRCDSTFLLEPLEAMLEAKEMYVLVVMDGREATIGVLKGTYFNMEKKLRSFAQQKARKGGQSAGRYERAVEESIDDYYKVVADAVNDVYVKYQNKLSGLVVGGPGPTKENFVKSKTLNYQVKILGTFDTGYTDEHSGVRELLEKAKDILSEQAVVKEKRIMERFLDEVSRNGLATYGYKNVKNALMVDNIVKLIISEDVELTEVEYKCTLDNQSVKYLEPGNSRHAKHEEDGGTLEIVSQKDAVEELIDMADKKGLETLFISVTTQYGNELLLGFQGIAAMLKYKK
ncbi:TPA: peptide chain release factor 1 [Candidatus Micrarchaeota archaeon]|nr:peptide chain release factor 1 [Candidatus Micrarchaeota archaeon]HII09608.1 peptide chain release factor 1 [Candidatus Micrarchaeota archaeon]